MALKKSKINYGTIGSMPCELLLNIVLITIGNAKVNHIVLGRYERFKKGLKALEALEKSWFITMVSLWKKVNWESFAKRKVDIPIDAYTHLLCCMTAQYRKSLRRKGVEK